MATSSEQSAHCSRCVSTVRRWSGLKLRLARKLAKVVHTGVTRDLINPGAERRSRAVALAVFQDAEEHLLDQVLAERAVAGQLRIKVEKRRLVAIEQHAQHFTRAIAHLEHQILVGSQSHCRIMVLNG